MITSEQVRAARALLRWDEQKLAEAARLPLATITRLEGNPGPLAADHGVIEAVRTALEAAGIDLLEDNGGGVGVWLQKANGPAIPVEELNASNDE
ncbi:MAG: transcriptional regulator [Hyphomicrobiales bacterium]|nr:transcriptional regulator [Hyphomicrobiales bacterium]